MNIGVYIYKIGKAVYDLGKLLRVFRMLRVGHSKKILEILAYY